MPLDRFSIIESTLREGEQFSTASFTRTQKQEIAGLLDEFGVEMIEMTSPCASPQSAEDIRTVVKMGLNARILTHIRCIRDDARLALAWCTRQVLANGLGLIGVHAPETM